MKKRKQRMSLEEQERKRQYCERYNLRYELSGYEMAEAMEGQREQWLSQNPGKGFYDGESQRSQIAGTAIPLEEHHREVRAERGMFDPQTGELDLETPVLVYDVETHARQVDELLIRMDGTRCNYPPNSMVRSTRSLDLVGPSGERKS